MKDVNLTVSTAKVEGMVFPILRYDLFFDDNILERTKEELLNSISETRGYKNKEDFIKCNSIQAENINGTAAISLRTFDTNLMLTDCIYVYYGGDRAHVVGYTCPAQLIDSWGEDLELMVLSPEIMEIE
jgi:hypothetical protein